MKEGMEGRKKNYGERKGSEGERKSISIRSS